MDKNYWKNHYAGSWKTASEKEAFVKKQIVDDTGLDVTEFGLGAGSTEYISGSAKDNKKVKGDADLFIKKLNTFIEVTGPNIPVDKDADLWFRPDKIQNAFKKFQQDRTIKSYFVHLQKDKGTNNQQMRVLVLDKAFFEKWSNGQYEKIHPYFGGKTETYFSIPSTDSSLISFRDFLENLKSARG